jgi:hypothetical protein
LDVCASPCLHPRVGMANLMRELRVCACECGCARQAWVFVQDVYLFPIDCQQRHRPPAPSLRPSLASCPFASCLCLSALGQDHWRWAGAARHEEQATAEDHHRQLRCFVMRASRCHAGCLAHHIHMTSSGSFPRNRGMSDGFVGKGGACGRFPRLLKLLRNRAGLGSLVWVCGGLSSEL